MFCRLALFLIMTAGLPAALTYAGTVFHLKNQVMTEKTVLTVGDVIEENIPAGVTNALVPRIYYSNKEIASMLRNAGFGDFILVGSGVRILPKSADEPAGQSVMTERPNLPLPADPAPEMVIRNVNGNTGEVVYRKGPVTVVVPVLIRSKRSDGTYTVQSRKGGRFFSVTVKAD